MFYVIATRKMNLMMKNPQIQNYYYQTGNSFSLKVFQSLERNTALAEKLLYFYTVLQRTEQELWKSMNETSSSKAGKVSNPAPEDFAQFVSQEEC